jgi:hypothetical protein
MAKGKTFGVAPPGLTASIANLEGVLAGPLPLRVPAYQRPYTWTQVEVSVLIEDLRLAFLREAPFYFIGHIVVVRNGRGDLEIADGQQRLATLTMLLAHVRDRLPLFAAQYQHMIQAQDMPLAPPRLRLREADAPFFLKYVQTEGGARVPPPEDMLHTDSQELMREAIETIIQSLEPLADADLDRFARFICRNATFDVIQADERGAAATVFATMNNRGRALSGPDIMKQELLERAELPAEEAEAVARQWEALEDQLGRAAFAELISDLMPIILTGEPVRAPGDLNVVRLAIMKHMTPAQFLRDWLPRHGDALARVRSADVTAGVHTLEVNRRIRCMLLLPETLWLAPAVAFVADRRGPWTDADLRFFIRLERLAFASFLNAVKSDRRESRFARVLQPGPGGMRFFGENRALELTPGERADLIARLEASFTRDSGRRKTMVLRLNAALPDGIALCFEDGVSVEHVLPLKPGADWHDDFPDPVERKRCASLMGNFVLLTHEQNRRAANKPYAVKREIYFDSAFGAPHALTKDIAGIERWTPAVIAARQTRMMQALKADWEL